MADSSFDIVSKIDRQEADNALNQAQREIATRYDFKNTGAAIDWSGEWGIEITANADERALAVLEVFKEKLIKRDISTIANLRNYPWLLSPVWFLLAVTLAFNFLGDVLRDYYDPYHVVVPRRLLRFGKRERKGGAR